MKRGVVALLLLLAFLLSWRGAGAATEDAGSARARRFLDAVTAYESGAYQAAAEGFEELARDVAATSDLSYDLGNAYLKLGDLGRAILWYERAARLAPGDPDVRYNLELARSRTRDTPPAEETDWYRLLFFWRGHLATRTLWLLAAGFSGLFWASLTVRLFVTRRGVLRVGTVCLAAALLLGLSAAVDNLDPTTRNLAIVLSQELPVRAGIAPESTELFRLHAGARVRVERSESGHLRIRFGEDKVGWIPEDQVGRVGS